MSGGDWRDSLVEYACGKLRDHFAQLRRCAGLLSTEQLWYRPNERSNSVGNLLLHLRGNVGQWIVGGVGGRAVTRDRPAEFAWREPIPAEKLVGDLGETIEAAAAVMEGLSAAQLAASYSIQGYAVTGIAAVMHIVEHFSYHTGQVVTITKWLLDVDLSLYDEQGRRLDGRGASVP